MKYRLGIIGIGTMGSSILTGILNKNMLNPNEITVFDLAIDKLNMKDGVHISKDLQDLVDSSDFVLFAVKPQHYLDIVKSVKFSSNNKIITIMAGIKINSLKGNLNYPCKIARIMPNTPCKIGYGISALCFDGYTDDEKEFVKNIFSTCGEIVELEESYFDTVTSISGSGPAYVYMFINAMIKGGIKGGLSFENAKKLTIATMIGASKLCEQSTEDLEVLIDKVCSKGGTTIQAVNSFNNNNLTGIIIEGIDACRKRSEELSNN